MPATLLAPPSLLREAAIPLESPAGPWAPLLDWIGEAPLVVIGDASCGTHELFRARAEITRRLIAERGFTTVAVEAAATEAVPVHRFVTTTEADTEAVEAFQTPHPFPAWQWRNAGMLDFAGWLRAFNEHRPPEARVAFYGLDTPGRHALLETTSAFLHETALSEWAAFRTACARAGVPCAPFPETPGPLLPARVEATLLAHLRRRHPAADPGLLRAVLREPHLGWNRYGCELADALDALLAGGARKVVVWAHAAHVADTRASDTPEAASLGQHLRERHAAEAFLVGLTTSHGTRTAAPVWGAPPERHPLPPAPPGSVEALFHSTGLPRFLLNLQDEGEATELLREPRTVRLPGPVAEIPECTLRLAEAFDAVAHFDETRALEPV